MSETNERSAASDGSGTSEFGDWFDAQFPPSPGKLSDKTIKELLDLVAAGSRAQDELHARQDRRHMEQAALSAWMARQAKEVPRE